MNIIYHDIHYCPKCGMHSNNIEVVATDNSTTSEAKTKCRMCNHEDYFAYGFFEAKDFVIHKNASNK